MNSLHPDQDPSDGSRLRGLSSLLMPPSVRKKLEAVTSVSEHDSESDAEAVARYYLLESTRQNAVDEDVEEPLPPKKFSATSRSSAQSEVFTARTERPVKGVHLRELYKVEQEMRDMSEALSSRSISEATISELNELETI